MAFSACLKIIQKSSKISYAFNLLWQIPSIKMVVSDLRIVNLTNDACIQIHEILQYKTKNYSDEAIRKALV